MAESDNRAINGVDNGWLGDCIIVSAMTKVLGVSCKLSVQMAVQNVSGLASQITEKTNR